MSIFLPLTINDKRMLYFSESLKYDMEELEEFITDNSYLNSKKFVNKSLFSREIKSNNTIEGYNDDIDLVNDVLKGKVERYDEKTIKRIQNLYNGYKFISQGKEINEENLNSLYLILSDGLLSRKYIENMDIYRKAPVYIYYTKNLQNYDEGVPYDQIRKYMEEYFSYINSNNSLNTKTEYFIKSQIMHFQFVNIHPYFDVNGRTSRTVSIWYLLNNKVYPYIIFNRGISLDDSTYCKIISETRTHGNITFFLKYMLDNVRKELEKEYILDMIQSNNRLRAIDFQTIYYILSMKGLLTAKDFISFYNRHNDKKRAFEVYKSMLQPLIDKSIIVKIKDTDSMINKNTTNFIFELNPSIYDNDPDKIKKLKLR